jgi:cystathionine beta-synthase
LANRQAHYEQTGPEIWEQTEGKVTHLIVATGTGGTIIGTGKYLKEKNPNIKIWAVDSYGSLLKKYFETGELDQNEVYPYISEGFGEDFVPQNYDMQYIDEFTKVTDKDGAVMARRIAKEEGMFCGYSAGSCLQGVFQLKDQLKKDDVVILHDYKQDEESWKTATEYWQWPYGFETEYDIIKDAIAENGLEEFNNTNANFFIWGSYIKK